jgi:hypothetical protein
MGNENNGGNKKINFILIFGELSKQKYKLDFSF